MKRIILISSFILLCSICSADQAAWITRKQADAAFKILSTAGTVRHYCEPCGDKGYRTEKIRFVKSGKVETEGEYYEVLINDAPVDLAYIYIQQKGRWVNLAVRLKIEVSGVSKTLPASVKELPLEGQGKTEMRNFELEPGAEGE